MFNVAVSDNFLGNFAELKAYRGEFADYKNHDGAVYPAICNEVPRTIKRDLYRAIEEKVGFNITPNNTFLRRLERGSVEPYQAHTDLNMGDYTCIVYKQGIGGTSFLRHKETGMMDNESDFDFDAWERDRNVYDAWGIWHFETQAPNKAIIYDATLMHRGEPIDGFGVGDEARELLICFFDMSLLQRTQDPDEIMEVLEHPAIWENIGGKKGGGVTLHINDDYHYLHADGALIILHREGDDWEIHVNITPEARGNAYDMAQEALRYAFEHLGANKVVAEIPEQYENVYQFSLKCGMAEVAFEGGEHKMALGYETWAL